MLAAVGAAEDRAWAATARVKELEAQVQELGWELGEAKEAAWMWERVDGPEFRLEADAWRRLAGNLLVSAERERQRQERKYREKYAAKSGQEA